MVGITLYPIVLMNVILRFRLDCAPMNKKYYNVYRGSRISFSWFSCGSLSWSNWDLEYWLLWREENWRTQKKTLGIRRQPILNKISLHMDPGGRALSPPGRKRPAHHCEIPALESPFNVNQTHPHTFQQNISKIQFYVMLTCPSSFSTPG